MQVFNINDSYFKYLKCLSGITYQYVNQLDNIYEKNLMVGNNYSIYCMYNEFDIINNFMVNLYQVDVCSTENLDITQKFYKIDEVPLKTKHRVILVGQTDTTQNNIYDVDSRGYLKVSDDLSNSGTTWRYKAYVKLGTNKGKQFHLRNVGNRFPLSDEKKTFLDGHGYIIKNYFNYDLFNIGDTSGIIPKLIFADYESARITVNRDGIVNNEVFPKNLWTGFEIPRLLSGGTISIKYHPKTNSSDSIYDSSYLITIIDSGFTYIYSGDTSGETISYTYYGPDATQITDFTTNRIMNINDSMYGPETRILVDDATALNSSENDYIKFELYGGTNLYLKTFIKRIESTDSGMTWITITDYIPDNVINDIDYYDEYIFTNLMFSTEDINDIKSTMMESFFNYYYDVEITIDNTLFVYPKEYIYNKYFDYGGLVFEFGTNSARFEGVVYGKEYSNPEYLLNDARIIYTGAENGNIVCGNNGNYLLDLRGGNYNLYYYSESGLYIPSGFTVTLLPDEHNDAIIVTLNHYLGDVTGTCYDSIYTGTEITGCSLSIYSGGYITGITDISGEYSIPDVLSGNRTIVCSESNYDTQSKNIFVPTGNTIEVDFYLYPSSSYQTASLSGTTIDIYSNPLSGVSIDLGSPPKHSESDISGEYLMTDIPINSFSQSTPYCFYTFVFSKYGYQSVYSGTTITYRQISELNVQLDYNKQTLIGNVSEFGLPNGNGQIISGATITITGTSFNSIDYVILATTDVDGNYSLPNILFGNYYIYYNCPNYISGFTSDFSVDGPFGPIDFNMEHEKGSFSGTVTGMTYTDLIEDATITVTDGTYISTTTSDVNGEYSLSDIRTGSIIAYCSKTEYATDSNAFSVIVDTNTPNIDFMLEHVTYISCYCIDDDTSDPIPNVSLILDTVPLSTSILITTDSDGYYMFSVAAGDYTVTYATGCYFSGITSTINAVGSPITQIITMQSTKPEPAGTITGLNTICQSTNGVVYSISSIDRAIDYVWSVPIGVTIVGGSNTTSITVDYGISAISGNISVYASNSCGNGYSSSLAVTVNVRPIPNIIGSDSTCQNYTGNIYSTESGMSGYVWTLSDGGTITSGSGTNSITVTWTTSGSKTVSINYTTPAGCTALTATVFNVTVITTPSTPTISGPTSCYQNQNVTYTTDAGFSNYYWDIYWPYQVVSGQFTNQITLYWTESGNKKIRASYSNGGVCQSPYSPYVSVTVTPL